MENEGGLMGRIFIQKEYLGQSADVGDRLWKKAKIKESNKRLKLLDDEAQFRKSLYVNKNGKSSNLVLNRRIVSQHLIKLDCQIKNMTEDQDSTPSTLRLCGDDWRMRGNSKDKENYNKSNVVLIGNVYVDSESNRSSSRVSVNRKKSKRNFRQTKVDSDDRAQKKNRFVQKLRQKENDERGNVRRIDLDVSIGNVSQSKMIVNEFVVKPMDIGFKNLFKSKAIPRSITPTRTINKNRGHSINCSNNSFKNNSYLHQR